MVNFGEKRLFLLFLVSSLSHYGLGEFCGDAVCEYSWEIRTDRTMVYRDPESGNVFNLELNGTDLVVVPNSFNVPAPGKDPNPLFGTIIHPDEVTTGDGFAKNMLTINNQSPGPTIEVYKGTRVIVRVTNYLIMAGVSIHWHGIHMTQNPWMDGAAFITQCPMIPKSLFVYDFIADATGTHWYHSHFKGQKGDGLYGLFVIHEKPAIPEPFFPFVVGDWYHLDATQMFTILPNVRTENFRGTGEKYCGDYYCSFSPDNNEIAVTKYESGLINGRGRYENNGAPLTVFNVVPGQHKRFRMVNAGSEYYYEISFDEHVIEVVASDGQEISPVFVDSVIIHPGEAIDYYVHNDDPKGNYWIRATTLHTGYGPNATRDGHLDEIRAILSYSQSRTPADPRTERQQCKTNRPCTTFNCPWPAFGTMYNTKCINFNDVTGTFSRQEYVENYGLAEKEEDVLEYMFNLRFNQGMSVNGRSFIPPWGHFFDDRTTIQPCQQCNWTAAPTCHCMHIVSLPINRTVQFVFSNYYLLSDGINTPVNNHHPIHIHNHQFAVVKIGYPPMNEETGYFTGFNKDIECKDEFCNEPSWSNKRKHQRGYNLENPAIKNTIIVPARGYTVVRFRTDSPGHWYVHCHNDKHNVEGMAFVIEEGFEAIPPAPEDFPKCHGFNSTTHDVIPPAFRIRSAREKMGKAKDLLKNNNKKAEAILVSGSLPVAQIKGNSVSGSSFVLYIFLAFSLGGVVTGVGMAVVNKQKKRSINGHEDATMRDPRDCHEDTPLITESYQ